MLLDEPHQVLGLRLASHVCTQSTMQWLHDRSCFDPYGVVARLPVLLGLGRTDVWRLLVLRWEHHNGRQLAVLDRYVARHYVSAPSPATQTHLSLQLDSPKLKPTSTASTESRNECSRTAIPLYVKFGHLNCVAMAQVNETISRSFDVFVKFLRRTTPDLTVKTPSHAREMLSGHAVLGLCSGAPGNPWSRGPAK